MVSLLEAFGTEVYTLAIPLRDGTSQPAILLEKLRKGLAHRKLLVVLTTVATYLLVEAHGACSASDSGLMM